MNNKLLTGLLVLFIILVLVTLIPLFPIKPINDDYCITSTSPEILLPVAIVEGAGIPIRVCSVQANHVYKLWENKYDTFFRTFTGQTSYLFVMSFIESDFHPDTTLGIELWDDTTKEVLDQKMLVLIQI